MGFNVGVLRSAPCRVQMPRFAVEFRRRDELGYPRIELGQRGLVHVAEVFGLWRQTGIELFSAFGGRNVFLLILAVFVGLVRGQHALDLLDEVSR